MMPTIVNKGATEEKGGECMCVGRQKSRQNRKNVRKKRRKGKKAEQFRMGGGRSLYSSLFVCLSVSLSVSSFS